MNRAHRTRCDSIGNAKARFAGRSFPPDHDPEEADPEEADSEEVKARPAYGQQAFARFEATLIRIALAQAAHAAEHSSTTTLVREGTLTLAIQGRKPKTPPVAGPTMPLER